MKFRLKRFLILLVAIACYVPLQAQVLPVGTPLLDDYYRRLQLLGKLDSTVSFNVRPLTNQVLQQENIYDPEGLQSRDNSIYHSKDGKGMVQLLPVMWQNQVNSSFPYGWNDAGMIPAKGYQTMLSAGFYAEYKFLSVQFRPEFVYAQNSDFPGYEGSEVTHWSKWYFHANRIDQPERFGTEAYTRFYPGQSSIRLNFHPISIGLSTESLWWGPGMKNSLLMSNNAPGFPHLTINTTRPIRTAIGSFEGQLVGGRLDASGFPPTTLGRSHYLDTLLYQPKPDDWRYFSGLVLSYQPKWIPGLSLGLVNVFTVYNEHMGNKLGDYLPFLPSGSTAPDIDWTDPNLEHDQAAHDVNVSVFARWVIPEAHFEIYGEFARNDRSYDMRDLIVQAGHSRSYMFGLRKMFPVKIIEDNEWMQIAFEMTQLEPSKNADLRPGGPMYGHFIVRDGYTNRGQVLGAGIGYGNNSQTLNVSWLQGMKQLGVQFERLVHNNALFYELIADRRRNWVDYSFGAYGEYDYKNFIFTGKLNLTHARNYQYQIGDSRSLWNFAKRDRNNLHLQVGMMYRF
ncbi:capsule assembly Wzi family protein [Olivibacter sp. SDN3]|uniref:capsule assembly Wzi family protein n=1 Tax=Olivibacter sp. SDN3 TaxID=2764720 RepID=UPI002107679C|nr:capsule assembly Wzi family protein [Olivibacter sp. SDN3]